MKPRDLVCKLIIISAHYFLSYLVQKLIFLVFLLKYDGLQIVQGNTQSVPSLNFGIWEEKIISSSQWQMSVVTIFQLFMETWWRLKKVPNIWNLYKNKNCTYPSKTCVRKFWIRRSMPVEINQTILIFQKI